jgi:hypothetical protein
VPWSTWPVAAARPKEVDALRRSVRVEEAAWTGSFRHHSPLRIATLQRRDARPPETPVAPSAARKEVAEPGQEGPAQTAEKRLLEQVRDPPPTWARGLQARIPCPRARRPMLWEALGCPCSHHRGSPCRWHLRRRPPRLEPANDPNLRRLQVPVRSGARKTQGPRSVSLDPQSGPHQRRGAPKLGCQPARHEPRALPLWRGPRSRLRCHRAGAQATRHQPS